MHLNFYQLKQRYDSTSLFLLHLYFYLFRLLPICYHVGSFFTLTPTPIVLSQPLFHRQNSARNHSFCFQLHQRMGTFHLIQLIQHSPICRMMVLIQFEHSDNHVNRELKVSSESSIQTYIFGGDQVQQTPPNPNEHPFKAKLPATPIPDSVRWAI